MDSGKIYTTEELSEILSKEMIACTEGERTFPMLANAEESVVKHCGLMGAIVGAEGMFGVFVYHQFQDQVHEYQRKHQVSGLTMEEIELDGKTVRFPEWDDQLALLDDDMDVLKASKERLVEEFVAHCQKHPEAYLYHSMYGKSGCEWTMQTTIDFVRHFANDMEWASLSKSSLLGSEVTLCLGYGNPKDASYVKAQDSDMFYFSLQSACAWSQPYKGEVVKLSAEEFVEKMKEYREKKKDQKD